MENHVLPYSITHGFAALLRHNGKSRGAKQPIKILQLVQHIKSYTVFVFVSKKCKVFKNTLNLHIHLIGAPFKCLRFNCLYRIIWEHSSTNITIINNVIAESGLEWPFLNIFFFLWFRREGSLLSRFNGAFQTNKL